jgi:hypothetical protein
MLAAFSSTILMLVLVTRASSVDSKSLLQQEDEDNIFGPRNVFIELTFKDLFVDDCSSFLLSKSSLQDEKISQVEYAEFLDVVCVEEGVCVEGNHLSYESINNNLQDLFLNLACPESPEEGPAACFYDFKRMGSEYGFVADPGTIMIIDERISSLCLASYEVINEEGIFGEKSLGDTDGDKKVPPQPQAPPPPTIPMSAPTRAPTNNPVTTATVSPTRGDLGTQQSPPTSETLDKSQGAQEVSGMQNEGSYNLTSGAIAGIISVLVVILFCVCVLYSGTRINTTDYDINQAKPIQGLHSVHEARNTIYDGMDIFRVEEDFGSYRDG